jgi:hypothetical protein
VKSAVGLLPTILASVVRKGRLRWDEIGHMIRLDALRPTLRRMKARHRVVMLDEGPVFGISWLDLAFADRGTHPPARWRRRALARWADLLDSVILLDADDAVLATRIRTRTKSHRMVKGSDVAIGRFAKGFRSAFGSVIDELNRAGRLAVHQVRTDGPLNRSAARIRTTLARYRNGH